MKILGEVGGEDRREYDDLFAQFLFCRSSGRRYVERDSRTPGECWLCSEKTGDEGSLCAGCKLEISEFVRNFPRKPTP